MVHRKLWEWCYILQALDQSGNLGAGKMGIGFGVGNEPITGWLASQGCVIVATDLPDSSDNTQRWRSTDQHAANISRINERKLCDPEIFNRHVTFEPVDMKQIPDHLTNFDFLWSSCALEHLGDLAAGIDYIHRSLRCLKNGGTAVHTTEYCVSSDTKTITEGAVVAYRQRDLVELMKTLRGQGHSVEVTFTLGTSDSDRHVVNAPYSSTPHIRIQLGEFVITSFGIVVTKRTLEQSLG